MFRVLVALLTTMFVALKLTGNIDWTWVVVLSPLILYVIFNVVFAIAFILAAYYLNRPWSKSPMRTAVKFWKERNDA